MAKGEHVSEANSADLDQYTKDALDEIFSKEQQSYDDFLERFMFLKKEVMTEVKSPGCYNKGTIHTAIQCPPKEIEPTDTEYSDSVPEEILDPGFRTPSIILRNVKSSGQPVPQVDNFVENEDEISDSEDSAEGHSHSNSHSSHIVHYPKSSASYSPSLAASLRTPKMSIGSHPCDSDLYDHLSQRGEGLTYAESIQEYNADTHLHGDVSGIPGEVEDLGISIQGDSFNTVIPNVRKLQISTKLKEYKQADIKEYNTEEVNNETCEVEPFTLDADFDYDNVTLTPKFSFLTGRI